MDTFTHTQGDPLTSTVRHAAHQLTGDRSHQCDATATYTHGDARAYALLDGIGSSDTIRAWTRTAARRLANTAARRGDAETGLREVYDRYAAEPERRDRYADLPSACAVVAVHAAGKLTVAWCGDARAYLLTASGRLYRMTEDHNMRRVLIGHGNRNRVTSWLGSNITDDKQLAREVGHPTIETCTRFSQGERLLLASDGAYEPLEDSCRRLADYLAGTPAQASRGLVRAAIEHSGSYADNATALVADL